MDITRCKVNHMPDPLGIQMAAATVSWTADSAQSARQTKARVLVSLHPDMTDPIYDTGEANLSCTGVKLPLALTPRTAHYWTVQVWGDKGDTAVSQVNSFETGKLDEPLLGQWLTTPFAEAPYVRKVFHTPAVRKARLYIAGLGLYHLEVNGQKVGNEYLAPCCTQPDRLNQIFTYDLTDYLRDGDNVLGLMLGNGWAKAAFGASKFHRAQTPFIDRYYLKAELRLTYADGTEQVLTTDGTWRCTPGPVVEDSLYGGEVYDARKAIPGWSTAAYDDRNWACMVLTQPVDLGPLADRLSLPVVIRQTRQPIALITTPKGETVLDMGQNMTGWLRIRIHEPAGTKILLQYGEILQDGCFYNENLRYAKAEYAYISDGSEATAEPHFTFYGFRYVKISGNTKPIDIFDFSGCVVYSDLEETATFTSSDSRINRLFQNALWSQRDNFLDVPTDCPQRDERMGWTGDAQMFCKTACYNMDTYAFYRKYMRDIWVEQQAFDGRVGHVAPSFIKDYSRFNAFWQGGSCAWGDAAVIIPWTLYQHYGDTAILEEFYPSMTGWVDWVDRTVLNADGLWEHGFKFGDWLALDGHPNQADDRYGGTDTTYVATAYLRYSAQLMANTAALLGRTEDAARYQAISDRTRAAMQKAYFTPDGTLTIRTQTAHVLALAFEIAREDWRPALGEALLALLQQSDMHLRTGFVGTPFLCHALSEAGYPEAAYTLLFQKDFPSWLYEVDMGATTIWERWNSVLPDGKISGTGMNSLNHYTYGSIVQWMYEHICGLTLIEPGFRKFRIRPELSDRFDRVEMSFMSPMGAIKTGWVRDADGYTVHVTVPFDTEAVLELPGQAPITLTPGHHTVPFLLSF